MNNEREEEEDQAGPSSKVKLSQKEKELQTSISLDSDEEKKMKKKKKRSRASKVGVSSSDSDRWTPEETEVHEKFRSTLKSKFQHLVKGVPNRGETRLLQEIFTKRERGRVNDEHEVRQIERASWREAARGRLIKCSKIFEPLSGHRQQKTIRTVLTKGVAGIGKTVSVQKFILDWTEGKTNQDVHFIFPLPFRELNLMMDKQLSLVELIQHFFPEIKDSNIFTSSKHRVMFIFDGLDECRLSLDFRSNLSCRDVTEPVSVNLLLTNLIKRNLLPSALLWITTRPAAASQIPPGYVDQVTEIMGFSDLQKKKYFKKYFKKRTSNENLASKTITHLKSSSSLYIMCYIPVFCWISATVVKRSFESEKVEMPRTLTQMYTHFLIIQTSIKHVKYTERKETDEEMIFKLGKLAFQQLEKGNLIFYEEDLSECGIDVTEASVYSGVCTQIFREESGLYHGKVFSFLHLSIQEFLAALYVFLCFKNTERSMSDQHQTSQLSALFSLAALHDLHKTAVDLALQIENGHLDLFLRFLLGLSLESNQNLLMHLLPQTRSQPQSSEQTVQYIKQKIRDQRNSDRRINLFYCLNELNHHAVVEVIDRSSGTLSVDMLVPGQWKTRRFKFKIPEEQLDEFDLQKYIKTPETDQTELLSPDKVLQRLVPVVTSALLWNCSLTKKSCAAIASAARSNSCSLKELNLSNNKLHDAGVQHLSELLKNPHCKLEKLELSSCSLTEKSCAVIASAARSNSCSLKELNLSHNELHDAGVQHLSELLKNPHCKLEKLALSSCSLTEKSCAVIASAARSNSCSLKELNLSSNKLHDAGVQHLSELLKNPHCKLEKLTLSSCSLTEKSCAAIVSAARSNSCRLKELNLSHNELHDAGVQHLSELLKNPHCKLEKLTLRCCSLTEKSCAVIASAARSNSCSLKELNLSYNKLHDAGVQHLSELLKNPHCKLEKLTVNYRTFLKDSPAAASAYSSHSAAELNLRDKAQQDPGAQLLSLDTHTEDHHNDVPQRSCESCAEVPDSSHWVQVEPEVSTESVSTYSLSSPAGSYECPESGLRWTCAGPVTLQYRFTDWHLLTDELPHMQYRPAGSSMDIKLISGKLEEIHLPHFLCLGGSQSSLKDAVEFLHKQDSGVSIEKCELSRFHARLVNPSFSLLGLFYSLKYLIFPGKEEEKEKQVDVHADVLVYQSSKAPLIFRTYLLPMDTHLKRLVEEQEKSEFRGHRLHKNRPDIPLRMNGFYALHTYCVKTDCSKTDCNSEICPGSLGLRNEDYVPNFFEVQMRETVDFKMKLSSSVDEQQVWEARILASECWDNPQASVEVSTTSTEEMPSDSSSPVQPASVSSSITAHTGGVVVCPIVSGNNIKRQLSIKIDHIPPK
ncbi:NACHT, LRR and PYD domains-containing protein 3-like isoform X2 [Alosa sapidissima]|uniref:NACHT, LRR and PYD domains-containing protein 3-like isoform X2 n=1 Tax=Alosa sapidissima TaxID=34773 RepID=UPI001C0920A6|nr:NACHT, LRR and PYD domains-containing protein 3-like isoform X2 [Alosa sapidissima]